MEARTTTTRAERGIALAGERGAEFVRTGPFMWQAPAAGRPVPYTVDLERGWCSCKDHKIRRDRAKDAGEPWEGVEACKHIYAAEIVSARRKVRGVL